MKHTLSIFYALFLFLCASAQQPTAANMKSAIQHPIWSVHIDGEPYDYALSVIFFDTIMSTAMTTKSDTGLNTTFFYLDNRTGKLVYRHDLPYGEYAGDVVFYFFARNDSVLEGYTPTNSLKFISSLDGDKLERYFLQDSIAFLQETKPEATGRSVLMVSLNRGKIIRNFNYPDSNLQGVYNNILLCHSINDISAYDFQTLTLLWKYKTPQSKSKNEPDKILSLSIDVRNDSAFLPLLYYRTHPAYSIDSVYILNLYSGKLLSRQLNNDRKYKLPPAAVIELDSIAPDDKRIGRFYVQDIFDTLKEWRFNITSYLPKNHEWNYNGSSDDIDEETRDSGKIYVSFKKDLWCLNEPDGKLLWHKHFSHFNLGIELFTINKFLFAADRAHKHIAIINENKPDDTEILNFNYQSLDGYSSPGTIYILMKKHRLLKVKLPQ